MLDYDIEGDLDLALGEPGIELFRNALQGPLEPVGKSTFPPLALSGIQGLVASDLDRDGDLDLLVAHAKGIAWLDNLRQGRFADRTAASGLAAAGPVEAVASADLDNDGLPDLIAAGNGLTLWHNLGGKFAAWNLPGLPAGKRFTSVIAFDADNDGRLDLAAAGPDGIVVLGQRGTIAKPTFEPLPVEGAPAAAAALVAADLDGDGDLDLVTAGPSGLHRLENAGGNQNHWLDVRLRALTTGNGKNNLQGIGSVAEVRAGTAYQFREAAGPPVHFGLGRLRQADVLRVVWTNGVPQDRLQPQIDQRIVEEQVLKGSCPFLYAWNGERFAFVTDLLWNSPVGLPVAPGVWAGSDPHELVRVDGARATDGVYRLRVTEELWEAAYFDAVRLWVVDHPAGVEVASSLQVVPGERQRVAVLAARDVHPVAAAWDGHGEDVTARVRARDEVYASGYEPGPYQGVAKPWTFTFDLGEAPGAPVRLLLDGWIFPADASLNLAAAQRPDFPYLPPRLEVETAKGWETLIPSMGFPAGKTKTMVVDTPPLPAGAHRLRIVTSLWLGWDRIAWTRANGRRRPRRPRPPGAPRVRSPISRLLAADPPLPQRAARLRLRGHREGLPLAALPRPLHPLRRRPRAAGSRGRPLRDPGPRRRDRPRVRRRRPAAGRARLAAHPVLREQRLGQGRRPQHLRGPADGAAAVPGDGEVWRSVPGYAGDAGVPGEVVDARGGADGAALKQNGTSACLGVLRRLKHAPNSIQPRLVDWQQRSSCFQRFQNRQRPQEHCILPLSGLKAATRISDTTRSCLVIGAVGFVGRQSLEDAERLLVEGLGLLALSESAEEIAQFCS